MEGLEKNLEGLNRETREYRNNRDLAKYLIRMFVKDAESDPDYEEDLTHLERHLDGEVTGTVLDKFLPMGGVYVILQRSLRWQRLMDPRR